MPFFFPFFQRGIDRRHGICLNFSVMLGDCRLEGDMTRKGPGAPLGRRNTKTGEVKHVSVRTFGHSFATLPHEAGHEIRTIQELLGHEDVSTTVIFTQVLNDLC